MHSNTNHRRAKASSKDTRHLAQQESEQDEKKKKTTCHQLEQQVSICLMKVKKHPRILRLRTTFEHSKLARWTCILFPAVLLLNLVWNRSPYYGLTTEEERCGLQTAFFKGDFRVGSHRSFGDLYFGEEEQPNSCLEGLMQLSVNGIRYLDLDLIWDPKTSQLMVAHPMEMQGTADAYAPCSRTPLPEVLRLLDTAMPKWFVSLEPKADWDRTHEFPLLQEPLLVLQETLKVFKQQVPKVTPQQCTLFVDANKVQPKEEGFLDQLTEYCSLSMAVRRYEGFDAQTAVRLREYQYIMPTIEFHPTHPNHKATTGLASLRAAQQTVPKSIYWLVDTPEDLERVALMRSTAAGIVSNRPLEMVKLFKDKRYQWCPTSNNSQVRKKTT